MRVATRERDSSACFQKLRATLISAAFGIKLISAMGAKAAVGNGALVGRIWPESELASDFCESDLLQDSQNSFGCLESKS